MAASTFLGLPVELQQHVMNYAEESDLLSLRLTCREVEAAALKPFGVAFLSVLRCFILDPRRLRRLIFFLSRPKFASSVKSVVLTLDAVEDLKKKLQFAQERFVERSWTESWTEHDWRQAYNDEQFSWHAPLRVQSNIINWSAVDQILALVSGRRIALGLQFWTASSHGQAFTARHPALPEFLLQHAANAGALSQLSGVSLSGASNSSAILVPSLEELHFSCGHKGESEHHLLNLTSTIAAADSLRKFAYRMVLLDQHRVDSEDLLSLPASFWFEDLISLPASFWSAGNWSNLTYLRLEGIRIELKSFLSNMLVPCGLTLTRLLLARVLLLEDGDPWKEVLLGLQEMPKLTYMDVHSLAREGAHDGFRQAHFRLKGRSTEIYTETREATMMMLEAAIDGIHYLR